MPYPLVKKARVRKRVMTDYGLELGGLYMERGRPNVGERELLVILLVFLDMV